MRIKNFEIKPFIDFLMNLELIGKKSRMRTRFVKLLMERQMLINEEHQELLKQYSELDEEGNPKVVEKDGELLYDVKDKISFTREYNILLNEDFVIEETEDKKEMLLTVQDIVLNCEMMFKGAEALLYDRFCEILEEIKYDE